MLLPNASVEPRTKAHRFCEHSFEHRSAQQSQQSRLHVGQQDGSHLLCNPARSRALWRREARAQVRTHRVSLSGNDSDEPRTECIALCESGNHRERTRSLVRQRGYYHTFHQDLDRLKRIIGRCSGSTKSGAISPSRWYPKRLANAASPRSRG